MLFASDEGKPHFYSTKGNSASDDRLSGKMGCGYLPPAVTEHSPHNKVGQDLVSLSALAVLQHCWLEANIPLSHFWLWKQVTLVKGFLFLCTGRISTVLNLGLGKGVGEAVLSIEMLGLLRCTCIFHLCCPCYIKCEGAGDATAGALHVIFTLLLMTLQGLAWPSPYASRLCLLAAATTGAKWDSFH